jgi:hypothetical protein
MISVTAEINYKNEKKQNNLIDTQFQLTGRLEEQTLIHPCLLSAYSFRLDASCRAHNKSEIIMSRK